MAQVDVRIDQGAESATLTNGFEYLVASTAWSTTDLSGITLSNDDKTATKASGTRAGVGSESGSAKSSGKWYAEFHIDTRSGNFLGCGVSKATGAQRDVDLGQEGDAFAYHSGGGKYFDTSFSTPYASFTAGDVIGIEVDIDNETIEFFKNGVSQGSESVTLDAGSYVLAMSADTNSDALTLVTTSADASYSPSAGFSFWV